MQGNIQADLSQTSPSFTMDNFQRQFFTPVFISSRPNSPRNINSPLFSLLPRGFVLLDENRQASSSNVSRFGETFFSHPSKAGERYELPTWILNLTPTRSRVRQLFRVLPFHTRNCNPCATLAQRKQTADYFIPLLPETLRPFSWMTFKLPPGCKKVLY